MGLGWRSRADIRSIRLRIAPRHFLIFKKTQKLTHISKNPPDTKRESIETTKENQEHSDENNELDDYDEDQANVSLAAMETSLKPVVLETLKKIADTYTKLSAFQKDRPEIAIGGFQRKPYTTPCGLGLMPCLYSSVSHCCVCYCLLSVKF